MRASGRQSAPRSRYVDYVLVYCTKVVFCAAVVLRL
jgi:hypothetical protein